MARRRNFQPPTRKFAFISRHQAVRGAARMLERRGWPRLQMFLIVAVTGLAGFLASVVLLWLGIDEMAKRYPLAIAIAYLVFLLQLWIWLHTGETEDGSNFDPGAGSGHPADYEGGGGDFGGGGASGNWDGAADLPSSSADAIAVDGEGCAVLLVVVAVGAVVLGLFGSAVYLVSSAPALMGELLVDAALSYGLYRNLRRQDRGFWLFTALRQTAWLFVAVAVLAMAIGALVAHRAPGARTLGEAWQAAHERN